MTRFEASIISVIWHRASHKDANGNSSFVPEFVYRVGDEHVPHTECTRFHRARLCSSTVPLLPY
jgi:hypothetical protein